MEKRRNLISQILEHIDYKGEISDDEDTIIGYREESNTNLEQLKNINEISQDKEDTKSTNAKKRNNKNKMKKGNSNNNNDDDENKKEENVLKIISDRQLNINEEYINNNIEENRNTEKSESIKFNKDIYKFKNENDEITDNNFAGKPNVFNYDNTRKNSSERSLCGPKIIKNDKNDEDINNFSNNKNNNDFLESFDEEKK